MWDNSVWAVGGTLWGVTRPVAWAFAPIGDGLGTGLVSGAKKEITQMVQPEGPLGLQLKQTLEHALLKQPPQEMLQLRELLNKIVNNHDTISVEDIRQIHACFTMLSQEEDKLLKHLAPDLSPEGLVLFRSVFKTIKEIAGNDHLDSEPGILDLFKQNIAKEPLKSELNNFNEVFNAILNRNQGALIQSLAYLQHALLSEENGILTQAVEVLKQKCTDENHGLMKQVVAQLSKLLTQKDGPMDVLSAKLSEGEESIISKAVALLKAKLLEKDGVVDELGKRFNEEEHGIIAEALKIARKNIDSMLKESLALLKDELTSPTGLMATLKQQVLGKDNSILSDAIRILNESLFKEDVGMVPRLRAELTHKDRGVLAEALQLLAKAINDEKDGILIQGIGLLKQKLTGEDGVLADAVRLLELKLNGPEGVIAKLQHRLLNEHDGALIQALAVVQDKLNHEKTGILAQSLGLLEKRLLAEHGLVDTLGKKLTEEENGILAQAVKTLKLLLEKKDGPLDVADQRLQKALAEAMETLKAKCLDENEGLLAKALELLMKKLNGKDGVVDQLEKRLLDENDGALTKVLAQLQDKLTHDGTGVLAQALAMLEKKLLDKGGIVDSLGGKLTAKDTGILDQALKRLKDSLESADGPLAIVEIKLQKTLADALEILTKKCLDEKDGLMAQGLEMLNKKLNAEHGVLDTLSKRLNDPKDGILAQAVTTLNQKLLEDNGTFSLLEKKLMDEKTGLVPQAVALLQSKLQENLAALEKQLISKDGTLDKAMTVLQTRLVDKDGILDQALNILEERLTNKDKGILVQAKKFLSEALTDDRDGIMAKAIDVLNRKLREKDGPIDYLELRLTDKDAGILAKAANVLQDKLMAKGGVVDQLDERLTGQAHPLLSNSRVQLMELRSAIIANNTASIKKFSKALEPLLGQLAAQQAIVFSKQPLDAADLLLLNQLKDRLPAFYGDTPPAQGEMMLAVEGGLSTLNRYYGSYAGIAARTGDILRETVTSALDPLLSRVENLPRAMVDNLLGRTPTGQSAAPQTTGAPGEGTVSQFLEHGGSILKTMIEKGGQALSKQAVSSFASVLALGLQQVIDKMDDSEVYRQPKLTLNGVISGLGCLHENGNWREFYTHLKDASQVLKGIKIYVNGFRVPRTGQASAEERSAEIVYSDNMSMLQEAIDTAPVEPESQDWKGRAQAEKNKLVHNTANFLTLKHIFEDVCKLKPTDEKFYFRLLAEAKKKGRTSESELKKLFFEELDKRKVNFVTKFHARIQYFFYGRIVKHYTAKASTIYFEEIFKYIDKHKAENFDTLRNQVTTNFTRYLTILGGAYKTVANTPAPTGTLDEMLKAELEKKESNLGFETKELYSEFAQTVLKRTTESGILAWIARKLIGNPEAIVRTVIDKATGSLQDKRGYTHALNSVIREQLDEVWKLLQTDQANPQDGQNPKLNTDISEGKKAQLAGLVKNLFEILRKTKCGTVDELHDLVKGKLLSAKVNQAVDDLFIEEVLEKVTNILAVAFQSLVKEDQLQKLTYKFASLVNRTFEVGEEVTEEQMQDEERKVSKRCEQILRLAINTAVEEKFDFSGKKQQKETNRFIQELHNRSRKYFGTAGDDLTALASIDLSSLEAKNKINKLVEEAMAYESECYESSFQAKSSKVSSDNKDEIGDRYLGIAEQSKPFVEAVAQIKLHARTIDDLQTIVPHLTQIKAIVPAIALRIFRDGGATIEDIEFAENQMRILETHLEELKKARLAAEFTEQITAESRTIATLLVNLRKAIGTRALGLKLAQPNSLIDQVAAEKKQHLGQIIENAVLKGKFAALRSELTQSVNGTYLPQLLGKLKTIEDAALPQQVDTANQEFLALLRQAVDQSAGVIEEERRKYWASFGKINTSIEGTHLLDPTNAVRASAGVRQAIVEALRHLQRLAEWEEAHVRQVPYINFSVVDMKGLQDWASGLVYNRVRERLDGFMGFLKREETYRYGLLNHLLLIPLSQEMRSAKKT